MAIIEVTVRDDQGLRWVIRQDPPRSGQWYGTSSFLDDPPEPSFARATLQESIAYIEAQQPQPVACNQCGARAVLRAGTNCGARLTGGLHCIGTLEPSR